MKVVLAVAGLVGLAIVSALVVNQLDRDQQFRTLMATGDAALAASNTYSAHEAFSGAVALRPDSMIAHLRRGMASLAQRRQDEAVRDFLEAARLQPGAADPLLALAALYDDRADTAQAAEWYARAALVDPQNPALLYRLALARYRAGQAATALDPLRRAVLLEPGFDEAHYLLGLAMRDTQDIAGAVVALERAIQANPALTVAREELADVYRAQGRFADEMAQLTALAVANAGGARDVAIGLAEARQGQFDRAIATLAAARTRYPTDSQVTLALGRVHLMRAESITDPARRKAAAQLALPPLEQALGGTARRSEGLTLFGRALYFTGDVAGAERLLQDAVATSPFDRDAFLYLADAAETLGQHGAAREWLSRYDAIEGDAAPPSVRTARGRRLGGLALAAGDHARALPLLERARQDGLADAQLLGWLAEARWKSGNLTGAGEALAQALAIAPRDPALRRLRQLIR